MRTEVPRLGYRHVVTEDDIWRFLEILPDREELMIGLEEIVLADGDSSADGRYESGVVYLGAWSDAEIIEFRPLYFEEHREIFDRIGIRASSPSWFYLGARSEPPNWLEIEPAEEGRSVGFERDERGARIATHEILRDPEGEGYHLYERTRPCRVSRAQARAFLLLHILVHELGHHRDSFCRRAKRPRGEAYAEEYANRHGAAVFSRYRSVFSL